MTAQKDTGLMVQLKRDWPTLLILLAGFLLATLAYPNLPDKMPMHWNFEGEIDRYSSRIVGALAIPVLNLAIYLGMLIMPAIDPKRHNYEKFLDTYRLLRSLVILFLFVLYLVVIGNAMGHHIPVNRVVPLIVCLLFVFLGNYLGRVKPNYFTGIRTPWTLASEAVWQKTHRFGGKSMVLAGLGGIVLTLTGYGLILVIPLILAGAFAPFLYSYVLYSRFKV